MVNEAICPKDVERQLVWMRTAFAIPLFANDSRVAVGVEQESVRGGRDDVSENFAPDLGWDAQ